MGLFLSVLATQLAAFYEVFGGAKLVVWNGLLKVADYFIQPWRNAFWFCFNIYVSVWSEIGSLMVKTLVFPFRIYNVFQKEDRMKEELQCFKDLHIEAIKQIQELESKLELALERSSLTIGCLEKAEGEKKAFLKRFQVLQLRVMHLQEENDLLKVGGERALNGMQEKNTSVPQQLKLRNSRTKRESQKNESQEMQRCTEDKSLPVESLQVQALVPVIGKTTLAPDPKQEIVPVKMNERVMNHHRARYEGWQAAILSSIFSVFLTLLVGTIAWHAEDPCVPLVVAVFMVVCMSLKMVAQFFSSVCSGPGLDAVALLSFNFFLLGALAYPVLPRVASTIAPYGTNFGHWLLKFTGVAYIVEHLKMLA